MLLQKHDYPLPRLALLAGADQRGEGDDVRVQVNLPDLIQEDERSLPLLALRAGADRVFESDRSRSAASHFAKSRP